MRSSAQKLAISTVVTVCVLNGRIVWQNLDELYTQVSDSKIEIDETSKAEKKERVKALKKPAVILWS